MEQFYKVLRFLKQGKLITNIEKLNDGKRMYLSSFLISFVLVNFIFNFYYTVMERKPMNVLSMLLGIRLHALGSYLLVLVLAAALAAVLSIKLSGVFFKTNQNEEKESKLITKVEDIKQVYRLVPERELSFPGYGGSPIARCGDKIFIDTQLRNQLIVGTTRAGKGQTQVLPSIDLYSRAEEKPSLLITDPKGELTRGSHNNLVERGYKVWVFNMINYLRSHCWNPLTEIINEYVNGDEGKAEELIFAFATTWFSGTNGNGDPFWDMNSKAGFTALIYALIEDGIRDNCQKGIILYATFRNFQSLTRSNENKKTGETDLDRYFKKKQQEAETSNAESASADAYFSIEISPGKTRSSIFAHMITFLKIFTNKSFAKLTSKNEIQLTELGFNKEQPVAIFICIPPDNDALSKLASLMLSQAFKVNVNMAQRQESGVFFRPIKGIYEELGNIANVEGLDTQLSIGAGFGFTADLYFQNDGQIHKYNTRNNAKVKNTIYSNCNNKFFIATDDDDTRKVFAGMTGERKEKNFSKSGGLFSLSKNITESDRDKTLVTASQLLLLREGEQLVIRTLSRRNLEGEKVRPYPLLTNVEEGTALKFAYQYIPEFDPDPKRNPKAVVQLLQEDREDIKNLDLLKTYYRLSVFHDKAPEEEDVVSNEYEAKVDAWLQGNVDPNIEEPVLTDIFESDIFAVVRNYLNDDEYELDFSTFTKSSFLLYLREELKQNNITGGDFEELCALLKL